MSQNKRYKKDIGCREPAAKCTELRLRIENLLCVCVCGRVGACLLTERYDHINDFCVTMRYDAPNVMPPVFYPRFQMWECGVVDPFLPSYPHTFLIPCPQFPVPPHSTTGLILPRFRDIAGFLLRRATPPLFYPKFGCSL